MVAAGELWRVVVWPAVVEGRTALGWLVRGSEFTFKYLVLGPWNPLWSLHVVALCSDGTWLSVKGPWPMMSPYPRSIPVFGTLTHMGGSTKVPSPPFLQGTARLCR